VQPNAAASKTYERLYRIFVKEKWGYIDKSGGFVISARFQGAYRFVDGVAEVIKGYNADARWGYIDRTGKWVWKPTK